LTGLSGYESGVTRSNLFGRATPQKARKTAIFDHGHLNSDNTYPFLRSAFDTEADIGMDGIAYVRWRMLASGYGVKSGNVASFQEDFELPYGSGGLRPPHDIVWSPRSRVFQIERR
jgi:hypothetical protein